MSFYPELCRALRRYGFHRTYHTTAGGVRMAEYTLVMPDREISAQIWGDGRHRMSMSVRGNSDTHPTTIVGVSSLEWVLQHEASRRDSKFLDTAWWRTLYPEQVGIYY